MVSIKTCISTYKDMWDLNGQWLPPGNYYYTITSYKDDKYIGNIYCKTLQAEFTFKGLQLISMMAQSQARLIRRTALPLDRLMPKYSSPSNSPISSYPKKLSKYKLSKTLFSTNVDECENCTICLLDIESNSKKLDCGHKFHKICIKRWLSIKDNCPICRSKVNKAKKSSRSKYVYRNVSLPSINRHDI
jgi:hypothetical protein